MASGTIHKEGPDTCHRQKIGSLLLAIVDGLFSSKELFQNTMNKFEGCVIKKEKHEYREDR